MTRLSAALIVVLASSAPAHAQNYAVEWWTVDNGGTTSGAGGTYALGGTAGQPDAGGPHGGGTYILYSGFWATEGGGGGVPQANLGITKTDGQFTVSPGQQVTYTIVASNAGPSPVTNATVSDSAPAVLTGANWNCLASTGSSCPTVGNGSIAGTVNLLVGGTVTFTMTGTISPGATGSFINTATVAVPANVLDPNTANNVASDEDFLVRLIDTELAHGSVVRGNLQGIGVDVDLYRIRQEPYASYELVIDETSGDIGTGTGPRLDLLAGNTVTVLASSQPVGAGPARSLRFVNATTGTFDTQAVRVESASCNTNCGTDDVYRLRAWETTARIARFNNSGTQNTVLILQNATNLTVRGNICAWSVDGAMIGNRELTLDPHALLVLGTATFTPPGSSGSITVPHDGPYGALVGKTVALEPSTGFSFDSPLLVRPR